jgi:hypothetical protein
MSRRPPQRHVLTDLGNGLGNAFGQGDVADLGRLDLLQVGADRQRDVGDHLHQALKQIIACDEIGFGVNLDHDAFGALHRHADEAIGRDAAGLLGSLGETSLAQQIDGLFHRAAGFLQRRLAVHHGRTRAFAQLLDHLRRDIGHTQDSFVLCQPVTASAASRHVRRTAPPLLSQKPARPKMTLALLCGQLF